MKRSGFKDSLFLFLKKTGIETVHSRLLEREKLLNSIFSDMSCFKCRPLDRKHQYIRIIQVRDAADVYNLYRTLCRNNTVVCSYNKDGKAEYTSEGITLKSYYVLENNAYISRILLSSDYQVKGIKEIVFKTVK